MSRRLCSTAPSSSGKKSFFTGFAPTARKPDTNERRTRYIQTSLGNDSRADRAEQSRYTRDEALCIRCGACRDVCTDRIGIHGTYRLADTADTAVCIHRGLYREFYGKPLSPLAEEMLHTHYVDRSADLGTGKSEPDVRSEIKDLQGEKNNLAKYRCTVCGYVHEGELSADFKCPRCKQPASVFVRIDEAAPKR